MNTQLSKSLMCISLRNHVEIWIEQDRAENLQKLLQSITSSKFIRFDGETFNSADVVGIFKADTMADLTRRKNGGWKCQHGQWHDRDDKCACLDRETKSLIEQRQEAIVACGKCFNGFVIDPVSNAATPCDCQSRF